VQDTSGGEPERFSSRLERGNLGQHCEYISQEKVGTFPQEDICFIVGSFFLLWEVVLYGFIQSAQQASGHGNRGSFGHFFEVDFILLVVVSGSYETVRTADCWHRF
jgi:hypothetical protein